ncbi:MAG: potassium channel protein [Myxococcales bacterium]|nr:potassium channel protein [Myxococcales bacterium]
MWPTQEGAPPGTDDDPHRALLSRLYLGLALMGLAIVGGALGFLLIGSGRWSFGQCLYMAVITLSTVGFGETLPGMDAVPGARAWTGLLILFGSGTLLYFGSTLTALIVDGDLRGVLRRRAMTRVLDDLHDHVILCGAGTTGVHVAEELIAARHDVVVIDRDRDRIERVRQELKLSELACVVGDATEDAVLEAAGIRRASGLIAALTSDRDNLFVTVAARALSDRVRVVAKAVDSDNVTKLQRVGAEAVVAPAHIGGRRLALEMTRPNVLQFLESLGRDPEQPRRIEEVVVGSRGKVDGALLREAGLRTAADALVLATRTADGALTVNPPPDTPLTEGTVLIVLVPTARLPALRAHVAGTD